MSTLWAPDSSIRKWLLPRPCEIFRDKYDTVTEQLRKISCMEDLLSGMLLITDGNRTHSIYDWGVSNLWNGLWNGLMEWYIS